MASCKLLVGGVSDLGYDLRGHPERTFEHAAGTQSFRGIGKDFGAAIAPNSNYSDHCRRVPRRLSSLYFVEFFHTLRADHRDEMAQFILNIAGRCNCLSNFL